MKYKIEFSNLSKTDLIQIKEYLSQFYPGTVKRFSDEFNKHKKILEESPHAFPIHRYVSQCRHFSVKDYIVLYHVIDQTRRIEIYRILHSSRDFKRHIKSEDSQ